MDMKMRHVYAARSKRNLQLVACMCAAFLASGAQANCPADVNENGHVGFPDLLEVLSSWGPCPGCNADIDESGEVGFSDLLVVLSAWGPCEPREECTTFQYDGLDRLLIAEIDSFDDACYRFVAGSGNALPVVLVAQDAEGVDLEGQFADLEPGSTVMFCPGDGAASVVLRTQVQGGAEGDICLIVAAEVEVTHQHECDGNWRTLWSTGKAGKYTWDLDAASGGLDSDCQVFFQIRGAGGAIAEIRVEEGAHGEVTWTHDGVGQIIFEYRCNAAPSLACRLTASGQRDAAGPDEYEEVTWDEECGGFLYKFHLTNTAGDYEFVIGAGDSDCGLEVFRADGKVLTSLGTVGAGQEDALFEVTLTEPVGVVGFYVMCVDGEGQCLPTVSGETP